MVDFSGLYHGSGLDTPPGFCSKIGGFEAILDFVQFSLIGCSFLIVSALVWLRLRHLDVQRPCRAWGYPLTPAVFLIGIGYIMFQWRGRGRLDPLWAWLGGFRLCTAPADRASRLKR
jgi:hypothetical protein